MVDIFNIMFSMRKTTQYRMEVALELGPIRDNTLHVNIF